MKQIRDSDVPTAQLVEFLEDTRVDNDVVNGSYTPAKVNTPNVPRTEDLPIKTASTEEEDTSKALEVKSGTAESGSERGWYRVEFGEPFQGELGSPIVNATGVQRTGEFSQAEYQPPSFSVEEIQLVGLDQIQLGQLSVSEIQNQQVQVGQVSAGQVEVGGVQIADISINIPEIQERSLQHQADISQEGIQIDTPQLGEDISFGGNLDVSVDFNFSNKDFSEDLSSIVSESQLEQLVNQIQSFDPVQDTKTIEERMKEGGRDAGRELYDIMAKNWPDVIPGKVEFLNAWDFALKRTYGAGDGEYTGSFNSGEGVYESAYGFIGSVIDDSFQFLVDQFVGNELDIVDQTNADLSRLRSDLVENGGAFDTYADIIESEIEDLISDELQNLDSLAQETDQTFSGIGSEIERIVLNQQDEINSKIVSNINQMRSEINAFAQEDVQSSLADVDSALSNTESEINTLSAETSDQMQLLGEDVNVAFADVTNQIQEQINVVNDELQVSVNEQNQQIVAGVNNQLVNLESQVNEVMAINQDSTNQSLNDMVSQVNSQLEDISVGVNNSIVTIEDSVNSVVDEQNRNNANIQRRVNSALAEVTAQAETSVNESLRLLYDTMGMPEGELMVPIQVRNVTNEGFEFLGYQGGTKINWTATGRTGSGNVVGGGDGSEDQDQIGKIADRVIERIEGGNELQELR